MATRGRPPSAKTLIDRQLGRNVVHPVLPAGDGFIIPNHSGDLSAGRVDSTPVSNLDPVNKKYVDDNSFTLPSLTAGSVLFSDGTTLAEDNFNLFWNDATNELQPNLIKITSDGTQAAPALKFNDTNTGFYKSGDSVNLSLNNSTKITTNATGTDIAGDLTYGTLDSSNITGAEMETLTDGSETTLHSHAGGGDVTAGANLTANTIIQGDDGAKGVKTSTATVAQIASNVTHAADNSQAHSDYLINNEDDETSGTLTAGGFTTTKTTSTGAFIVGSLSPPVITSNQNDYTPTGLSDTALLQLRTDTSRTVTGLGGGIAGRVMYIKNTGNQNLVLSHNSGSSSAGFRFAFASSAAITLPSGAALQCLYDADAGFWRDFGSAGV